jgi:hypothetical protein
MDCQGAGVDSAETYQIPITLGKLGPLTDVASAPAPGVTKDNKVIWLRAGIRFPYIKGVGRV